MSGKEDFQEHIDEAMGMAVETGLPQQLQLTTSEGDTLIVLILKVSND